MTSTKTFRLFISSTFSDFRQERQVLHEKVFPVIEKYCSDQGYQFQPVDLRWGVSAEAQLDQKTLELCLNEVRACKHFPHPNFLIMLGNRYGWIPLPYAIEKSEFELILNFYPKDSHEKKLLTDWYIEDTNHIMETSYAYVLKQREPDGAYKNWQEWEKLENELRSSLQEAVNTIFPNKEDPQYRKYFLSATEAEVEEGIYQYLNPTQKQLELAEKENKELPILDHKYVYGWIRNIDDIGSYDKTVEPVKSFIDVDQTPLEGFKDELRKVIASDNLIEPTISLTQDKEKLIDDSAYFESFIDFMTKKLIDSVKQQILEAKQISDLEQERSEQKVFKDQKNEIFLGRQAQISQIASYINKPSHQPFIVHGISGIGKSAFMAEIVNHVERLNEESKKNKSIEYRPLVYRFIGATASSSYIRSLLELLIEDLADQNVLVKPESFEADSNKFNEQIKELINSIENPTIIILDALDQLQHNDWLQWLPLELPGNLKIILSMLDQENYDHYFKLLTKKIDKLNQLAIEPLKEEGVAKQILEALLKKEQRTLTDQLTTDQFQYVIDQYTNNESSPLYLKIAFEEVKLWKSSDSDQTLSDKGVQGIIKEFIDNLTTKYHHDKTIVHKILGLIAASRDGLSEKEILDLLSRDEAILNKLEKFNKLTLTIEGNEIRRFPISIWSRLHTQLKPFLNERLIDGQSLITFFHRQITEAVNDHIYQNTAQELHIELADYFLSLQDKDKLWDKRYYNLHMLDEIPYQLFHAKDSQRLKEILFDLEFAGSVYDHHKQESFKAIMEQAPKLEGITQDEIYPWMSFYNKNEIVITRLHDFNWYPHQSLFQNAYEDGDDSPLSNEADKLIDNNKICFIWLKNKFRKKKYERYGLQKISFYPIDSIRFFHEFENYFAVYDNESYKYIIFNYNLELIKTFEYIYKCELINKNIVKLENQDLQLITVSFDPNISWKIIKQSVVVDNKPIETVINTEIIKKIILHSTEYFYNNHEILISKDNKFYKIYDLNTMYNEPIVIQWANAEKDYILFITNKQPIKFDGQTFSDIHLEKNKFNGVYISINDDDSWNYFDYRCESFMHLDENIILFQTRDMICLWSVNKIVSFKCGEIISYRLFDGALFVLTDNLIIKKYANINIRNEFFYESMEEILLVDTDLSKFTEVSCSGRPYIFDSDHELYPKEIFNDGILLYKESSSYENGICFIAKREGVCSLEYYFDNYLNLNNITKNNFGYMIIVEDHILTYKYVIIKNSCIDIIEDFDQIIKSTDTYVSIEKFGPKYEIIEPDMNVFDIDDLEYIGNHICIDHNKSENDNLVLVDIHDRKIFTITTHNAPIRIVKVLDNNIITIGEDNKICKWDFSKSVLVYPEDDYMVSFLLDDRVVTVLNSGDYCIWDEKNIYTSSNINKFTFSKKTVFEYKRKENQNKYNNIDYTDGLIINGRLIKQYGKNIEIYESTHEIKKRLSKFDHTNPIEIYFSLGGILFYDKNNLRLWEDIPDKIFTIKTETEMVLLPSKNGFILGFDKKTIKIWNDKCNVILSIETPKDCTQDIIGVIEIEDMLIAIMESLDEVIIWNSSGTLIYRNQKKYYFENCNDFYSSNDYDNATVMLKKNVPILFFNNDFEIEELSEDKFLLHVNNGIRIVDIDELMNIDRIPISDVQYDMDSKNIRIFYNHAHAIELSYENDNRKIIPYGSDFYESLKQDIQIRSNGYLNYTDECIDLYFNDKKIISIPNNNKQSMNGRRIRTDSDGFYQSRVTKLDKLNYLVTDDEFCQDSLQIWNQYGITCKINIPSVVGTMQHIPDSLELLLVNTYELSHYLLILGDGFD